MKYGPFRTSATNHPSIANTYTTLLCGCIDMCMCIRMHCNHNNNECIYMRTSNWLAPPPPPPSSTANGKRILCRELKTYLYSAKAISHIYCFIYLLVLWPWRWRYRGCCSGISPASVIIDHVCAIMGASCLLCVYVIRFTIAYKFSVNIHMAFSGLRNTDVCALWKNTIDCCK